jgi:hypothetical protein
MNETEARDFIAKEVNRLLWMRVAGFATLFGVANIAAFITLWYSVTGQAELIARGRASEVAEKESLRAVEGAQQRIDAISTLAEDQVKELFRNNSDLSKRLVSSEMNLAALESSYKALESKLKDLESTAKRATEGATHQFAKAVAEFAALPDDQRTGILQAVDIAGKRLQDVVTAINEPGFGVLARLDGLESKRTRYSIGKGLEEEFQHPKVDDTSPILNKYQPVLIRSKGVDLAVSIMSTGRPLMISLLPQAPPGAGGIGLDTRTNGKPLEATPKDVYARVRVMRRLEGENETKEVGIVNIQVDWSRLIIPPSALQVLDEKPPTGNCTYTLQVMSVTGSTVTGKGTFYFSKGTRMIAWEL